MVTPWTIGQVTTWQCGSTQVEGGAFLDTQMCNLWESRNQTAEVAAVLRELVGALQAPVDWLKVRAILARAKHILEGRE